MAALLLCPWLIACAPEPEPEPRDEDRGDPAREPEERPRAEPDPAPVDPEWEPPGPTVPTVRPTLSLTNALGRDRAEIEAAWGAAEEEGAYVRYADGRRVRYREGVAVAIQGRAAERSQAGPPLSEWLGVGPAQLEGCRRNRDGWCESRLDGVMVERRARVYRLTRDGTRRVR